METRQRFREWLEGRRELSELLREAREIERLVQAPFLRYLHE